MTLQLTEDLVTKLNNAAKYWNQNFHKPDADSSSIEKYFDYWCKEIYGLKIGIVENSTTIGGIKWLSWNEAEVLDDEKYTWFLLTF
jgi:hypothetical protein